MLATFQRQYRIMHVIGEGGHGKVYHAILETTGGFRKDVAIKLLRAEDSSESLLARFRDEARILGLVRDRAVVTVDAPTHIIGQPALVMEYVPGVSARTLLKRQPPPVSVALEIVQEIARALHKVYWMPGPDGEPLRVLHRDLKPANIQVTPDGEVKILDFGIAHARLENREAVTSDQIMGTMGFIAPERFHGVDGPASDVYSLGIVLRCLILGERSPQGTAENIQTDAEQQRALGFVDRMTALCPEDRPSAQEVEAQCEALRGEMKGTTLRAWAAEFGALLQPKTATDLLCGVVLTDSTAASAPEAGPTVLLPREVTAKRRTVKAVKALGLAAALVVVGVGSVVLLRTDSEHGATQSLGPSAPQTPAEHASSTNVEPLPTGVASVVQLPDPSISIAPEPPTLRAFVAPNVVETLPGRAPRSQEAVIEAPSPGEPDVPVPTLPVTFSSVPLGAEVFIDGVSVGTTPIINRALSVGVHRIEVRGQQGQASRDVEVGRRLPARYVWEGGETWAAY